MGSHLLSKSSFIKGIQCEKQLYLYKYHYDERDEISENLKSIFAKGWEIGNLARELFPGGIDLQPENPFEYDKSSRLTAKAIRNGKQVIYEAAFIYNDVLIANDILVNDHGKWKAYEVKSTTQIKDPILLDAAVQYYVITGCGLKLSDFSIIYINNEYVRQGDINIHSLFNIESVFDKVIEQQKFIGENVGRLKEVLKGKSIPEIDINENCGTPYGCSFMGYCWKHIPENSVFDITLLSSKKKFELYNSGIIHMKDVPDDYPLSPVQQIQVDSIKSGQPNIDKHSVREFTKSLHYPLYFMDFETMNPAIPLFNGTRPYQQIPFQYSVHCISSRNAEPVHYEFLAEAGVDPREGFIQKLISDIGEGGDIIVYNKSFESNILRSIAEAFPDYQEAIEAILPRIKDLMELFRSKAVYFPEFNGSYSIKSVLPVLVPELSYDELEIGDGGMASLAFESLQFEKDRSRIEEIRKQLLVYCGLDTWAMVRIVEWLVWAGHR